MAQKKIPDLPTRFCRPMKSETHIFFFGLNTTLSQHPKTDIHPQSIYELFKCEDPDKLTQIAEYCKKTLFLLKLDLMKLMLFMYILLCCK